MSGIRLVSGVVVVCIGAFGGRCLLALEPASPAAGVAVELRVPVARGQTLAEVLPLLGATYGETLRCGPNAADRRLILLPADRPLPEIMRQLKQFVPVHPGSAG